VPASELQEDDLLVTLGSENKI